LHPSSPDEFTLVVADVGTTRTITPRGELDIETVGAAGEALVSAFADGHETVVFDLGETTFLDSTGIRLVLEADARARRGNTRLVVLPGPPHVHRVFEVCGLADELPFVSGGRDGDGSAGP
jgi:anti-anti-sigma factor